MYLLIHHLRPLRRAVISYLHPTMYLLIRHPMSDEKRASFIFTSHYVSINSLSFGATVTLVTVFTSHYVSINSLS